MNTNYKLPYFVQWGPLVSDITTLKRPVQDAVVLLEPRKVSMARMKSMNETSLQDCGACQNGNHGEAYYGKHGAMTTPSWPCLQQNCRCNLFKKGSPQYYKVVGEYFGSQE